MIVGCHDRRVTDWATISSLATGAGTLVLAVATFASVRSANRSTRIAEQALQVGLRPLLLPSRLEDPPEKVGFVDGKWLRAPGGGGAAEVTDEAVYLAISVRNVGTGIAVLHGWRYSSEWGGDGDHPSLEEFHRLTRDLYVAAGDTGFWQGAFRDPGAPEFEVARDAVESRSHMTIDVLYGDHEGGQRVITRFAMRPRDDGQWIATAGRHWNVDRPDPR